MFDQRNQLSTNSDCREVVISESELEFDEEAYRSSLLYLPSGELDRDINLYYSDDEVPYADLKVLGLIAREYIERELRTRHREVSTEIDRSPGVTLVIREIDASPSLVERVNEALGIDDALLWFMQHDDGDFAIRFDSSLVEFDIFCYVKKSPDLIQKAQQDVPKTPIEKSNES